jgi:hypothetical protein
MTEQGEAAIGDAAGRPEPPAAATRRRLLRGALVVATAILGVLVCWQDPSYAHDGVRVTVHHDGRGSVWIDTAWQDGHPVREPVTALMTAYGSDGAAVRPVALRTLGGGAARYGGTLGRGTWTVTVDVAAPGVGTCTATVAVGPGTAPGSVTCGTALAGAAATAPTGTAAAPPVATAATATAATAAAPPVASTAVASAPVAGPTPSVLAGGVALLGGMVVGVLVLRRRSRPAPRR